MVKPANEKDFNQHEVLEKLRHFLPDQAPLKDFIHHNSLHAFQDKPFFEALKDASRIFGYRTCLPISEFRSMYEQGRIPEGLLVRVISEKYPSDNPEIWINRMVHQAYDETEEPRIGMLRETWGNTYHFDLESFVQPTLFRLLCSYLDQGISIWEFPVQGKGFVESLREMEKNSFTSFFRSQKARKLFLDETTSLETVLHLLVGNPTLYQQYLFDQQFSHQGWSGMVAVLESRPEHLLHARKITLADLILVELLLELDTLEIRRPGKWRPLAQILTHPIPGLFDEVETSELDEIRQLWQTAFEWSFFDQVLAGIQLQEKPSPRTGPVPFQAVFCIDDRECSFRRHIENLQPGAETFGTPGFFGIDAFFQPQGGKFYTKICPAPVRPRHLIRETGQRKGHESDIHFSKHTNNFFSGWFIAQTVGFWAAFRLALNIFRPSMGPATASSFKHIDPLGKLEVASTGQVQDGLQLGYSIQEMSQRVEQVLTSIGLTSGFAPLVYIVGHGASSVNNPHFAAYDCGACSGRAGSANAKAFCQMANHPEIRIALREKGISIPDTTIFLSAIHDTTRDEVCFFDAGTLPPHLSILHGEHVVVFNKALDANAKERSRRFLSINTRASAESIHQKIRARSVSLFEPRPELNHATNALCIVGRRSLTKGIFLDRRSFLNSYDYRCDPEGKSLLAILNAAAPVCGGINLEYYFSRVDNQKLGAGTKLPHNVMGLFGVANGIDGDLRPGLPAQMIEMHDPVRLMMVVEHFPEIVLDTIQRNQATYNWFRLHWIILSVIHPETRAAYVFKEERFEPFTPFHTRLPETNALEKLIESTQENFPVYLIQSQATHI